MHLDMLVGIATKLNFHVALGKAAVKVIQIPHLCGGPLVHHAGDDNGLIDAVVVAQEGVAWQLMMPLNVQRTRAVEFALDIDDFGGIYAPLFNFVISAGFSQIRIA